MREAPVLAPLLKRSAGERRRPGPQAPMQTGRCLGAAAQLAVMHRTLRHGPALQLQPGGAAADVKPVAAPTPTGANRTGLPDWLKSGVEALSGVALDDVRVHRNSARPAKLQAHAYTQGSDIHVGPGQERHLAHEAWHVVQQKQGRVAATRQLAGGIALNTDSGLEREADLMGARAAASGGAAAASPARSVVAGAGGGGGKSAVVQRVGGEKFGLERTGGATATVQLGIDALKRVQAAYKAQIKNAKTAAAAALAVNPADKNRQTVYAAALASAEMHPDDLLAKLATEPNLTHNGDVISFQGVEIARIKRGAQAYVESEAADVGAGKSAIFKKHTLEGQSAKEYVDVAGLKLRRFAYRGITPAERASYKAYGTLSPMTPVKTAGAKGFSFSTAGVATPRAGQSDLQWLSDVTGKNLNAIPNDPRILAFVQTRKGAGKYLSATSTPKPITSNHGAAFTGFGKITIDLARVPAANIVHHYKQQGFTTSAVKKKTGAKVKQIAQVARQVHRANETVIRNRELVLTAIPHTAVTALEESPERAPYEAAFKLRYSLHYATGYTQALAATNRNYAVQDPPPVPAWPWKEDHFTTAQGLADADVKTAEAKQAGTLAAAGRISFGNAYAQAYRQHYILDYAAAAKQSPYALALSEGARAALNVPEPNPAVGPIPVGTDPAAGGQQGQQDGKNAGAVAGAAFSL